MTQRETLLFCGGLAIGDGQRFRRRPISKSCVGNHGQITPSGFLSLLLSCTLTFSRCVPSLYNCPKSMIRAVQTPVAALSLLLLPFFAFRAWRRGDRTAFELTAAVATALIANAALGGGLSDVHDRYQSRVIWIVPFIILLLELRWRGIRSAGSRS